MSKGYLLDVNVLISIGFTQHQFNTLSKKYLGHTTIWATCFLTQLGFIRISSNNAIFSRILHQ